MLTRSSIPYAVGEIVNVPPQHIYRVSLCYSAEKTECQMTSCRILQKNQICLCIEVIFSPIFSFYTGLRHAPHCRWQAVQLLFLSFFQNNNRGYFLRTAVTVRTLKDEELGANILYNSQGNAPGKAPNNWSLAQNIFLVGDQ